MYDWPNVTTVNSSSLIGQLQAKTSLNFDLPTESQWEYACRARTTSGYNNGGIYDADIKILGRYTDNRTDGRGGYGEHTTVGAYAPNAWGLYDMHGNVYEWCLDWDSSLNGDAIADWTGASSGSFRVLRGGYWYGNAGIAGSSYRSSNFPSDRIYYYGFRLSRTIEE